MFQPRVFVLATQITLTLWMVSPSFLGIVGVGIRRREIFGVCELVIFIKKDHIRNGLPG